MEILGYIICRWRYFCCFVILIYNNDNYLFIYLLCELAILYKNEFYQVLLNKIQFTNLLRSYYS
jgi:hypothetical protein